MREKRDRKGESDLEIEATARKIEWRSQTDQAIKPTGEVTEYTNLFAPFQLPVFVITGTHRLKLRLWRLTGMVYSVKHIEQTVLFIDPPSKPLHVWDPDRTGEPDEPGLTWLTS